jgi:hypothetical protein
MGRPTKGQAPIVFSVKLVLYEGEDDDLLRYLRSAPVRKRAAAVKLAMRSGEMGGVELEGVPSEMEMGEAFGAFLA